MYHGENTFRVYSTIRERILNPVSDTNAMSGEEEGAGVVKYIIRELELAEKFEKQKKRMQEAMERAKKFAKSAGRKAAARAR